LIFRKRKKLAESEERTGRPIIEKKKGNLVTPRREGKFRAEKRGETKKVRRGGHITGCRKVKGKERKGHSGIPEEEKKRGDKGGKKNRR